MKSRVDAQRRDLRQEHLRAGTAALGRADESVAAAKHFVAAVTITPLMAQQLIQTLRKLGVDFVVAPYEADAQLAWLVREGAQPSHARLSPHPGERHPLLAGHCAAAITEDSDLLAYQCPAVLYKIKSDGHARLYSWADVRTISGVGGRRKLQPPQLLFDGAAGWPDEWEAWEASLFTDMCILSGCDYLPSIPGVGLKTAHATLRQFRTVERAIASLLPDRAALGMPPELYLSLVNKAQARCHDSLLGRARRPMSAIVLADGLPSPARVGRREQARGAAPRLSGRCRRLRSPRLRPRATRTARVISPATG